LSLGGQSVDGGQRGQEVLGLRVLVADDDATVRRLYMNLLGDVPGISSVVDAADGHEAVLIARRLHCDIAVLDFNMPRVDGVDAALVLRRDFPPLRVAVHSADPYALAQRAAGSGLAMFDKLDLDRLLAWVERQAVDLHRGRASSTVAALAPRRGFSCSRCGYGVMSREPPGRCPMCDRETIWDATPSELRESGYRSFG
jgi:CheY-like chemotaxis protein